MSEQPTFQYYASPDPRANWLTVNEWIGMNEVSYSSYKFLANALEDSRLGHAYTLYNTSGRIIAHREHNTVVVYDKLVVKPEEIQLRGGIYESGFSSDSDNWPDWYTGRSLPKL